ncbi:glycosyltransferase [Hymenobacter sp. BT683]|uniref:Glycosyltransferase n=2 Tax=Hymenobacter jeongseonensis TaxID=2791027 RepID=A0ABS0IJH8_9BACT|nr:glycosyltransferase [Hymenobacter jeongseonensis]
MLHFLWWFFTTLRMGYAPLFWLLAVSLGFKLLKMLHEWVHYVQVQEPVPPTYTANLRRVDVLTTACPGEPHAMIIRTLEAMQAIRYPHTSYLCDEGNDPVLRAACARLGVVHVTRTEKKNAKAGNINNALRQATGEFCVVLDPDHVPTPNFLDEVMPYFEDERVGFVQVVQAYGNQQESLVAKGAAEQTYHFYGPLMMGMNGYGTVQAIGANCTFRRVALDSIGGHAPGLTEDMHTAMRLHAEGWQSVYVPKVVSRGLVPASLAAFYSQQLKWSRGAFDLLFRVYPKLLGRFSWPQRLHYLLLPLYFFSGVIALIDLSLPVLSLGLSQFPWLVKVSDLAVHALPLMGMSLLIRCYAQRWLREPGEGGLHLAGGFLRIGSWWVYALGFVYAVVGVRVPYLPTPKEGRWGNEWLLVLPNLLLVAILLGACKYGRLVAYGPYTNTMVLLALLNVVILLAATFMGQHQVLRNFIEDMAAKPFRGVVLGLHQVQAGVVHALVPRLRRFGPLVALSGLALVGSYSYARESWLARVPPEWMLTGTHTLRLGQAITPFEKHGSATLVGLWTETPEASEYDIAALTIPAPTLTGPLPAQVDSLVQRRRVPLLTWTARTSATDQKAYWQHLAQQISQIPGPVMLRPILQAPNAAAYRQAWKEMVRAFRKEQVINAVWVWTPVAADSLMQQFPGVAYADWIASPLLAQDGAPDYAQLRTYLSENLALHQLPVVLLAPTPKGNPQNVAQRLNWEYPEIKAIVFPISPKPYPETATEWKNRQSRHGLGG